MASVYFWWNRNCIWCFTLLQRLILIRKVRFCQLWEQLVLAYWLVVIDYFLHLVSSVHIDIPRILSLVLKFLFLILDVSCYGIINLDIFKSCSCILLDVKAVILELLGP